MKKLLSVLLAVLMIFSTVAISASAATPITNPQVASDMRDAVGKNHVIIHYNLYDFKTKYSQWTFDVDSNKFAYIDAITGSFYQIPESSDQFFVGYSFALPEVTAPEGKQFNGWRCTTHVDRPTFAAGEALKITNEMLALSTNNVIEFEVVWGSAVPEEDTMGTIIDILCKVFGAIIGLLFFNGRTEAGVALMQEILGGIMG